MRRTPPPLRPLNALITSFRSTLKTIICWASHLTIIFILTHGVLLVYGPWPWSVNKQLRASYIFFHASWLFRWCLPRWFLQHWMPVAGWQCLCYSGIYFRYPRLKPLCLKKIQRRPLRWFAWVFSSMPRILHHVFQNRGFVNLTIYCQRTPVFAR